MKKQQSLDLRPASQPSALLLLPTSELSLLDPQNVNMPTLLAVNSVAHGSASQLFPADDIEVDSFLGQVAPKQQLNSIKTYNNYPTSMNRPSSHPNLVSQNITPPVASTNSSQNLTNNHPALYNTSYSANQSIVINNYPPNMMINNMGFSQFENLNNSNVSSIPPCVDNELPPRVSTASNFRMVGRKQYALPQDMHGYKSSSQSQNYQQPQQIPDFNPISHSNYITPPVSLYSYMTPNAESLNTIQKYGTDADLQYSSQIDINSVAQYTNQYSNNESLVSMSNQFMTPAEISTSKSCSSQQYNLSGISNYYEGTAKQNDVNLIYHPPNYHWFYMKLIEGKSFWRPFTHLDSSKIENMFQLGSPNGQFVSLVGGRYEADVSKRIMRAVYWDEMEAEIRRCFWFLKLEGTNEFVPFDEHLMALLEESYYHTTATGDYHKRLDLGEGQVVVIHSPDSIVSYQTSLSSLNPWDTNSIENRPQVIKRGIAEIQEIYQGESEKIDHLVFVVAGIGSTYALKNQMFIDCVNRLRNVSDQMLTDHFNYEQMGRIEFLPIIYNDFDKEAIAQIHSKLKSTTITSMAKLRYFTNETFLDILYYLNPSHAKTTAISIGNQMNLIYERFKLKNPYFQGGISIIGHGTGGLQVYDLLLNQNDNLEDVDLQLQDEYTDINTKTATEYENISLLLKKLNLEEYINIFQKERLDIKALNLCSENDLKDLGLPLGSRKSLLEFLKSNSNKQCATTNISKEFSNMHHSNKSQAFFRESITGGIDTQILSFTKLDFHVANFFALGSPIGLINSLRGIQFLGDEFSFPSCPSFFNIFHPYDPLAYRMEPLIVPHPPLKALFIPHHKGRKRMHLELKESLMRIGYDIKQRITDSIRSTWNAIHSLTVGSKPNTPTSSPAELLKQNMEFEMKSQVEEVLSQLSGLSDDSASVATASVADESEIPIGNINQGRRVDHVLQERPLEIFNDYIFALSSSACYWDSEDTALLMLKEIYIHMGILPKKLSQRQWLQSAQPPKCGFIPHKQATLPPTDHYMPPPFSDSIRPGGYSRPPSHIRPSPYSSQISEGHSVG